MTRREEDGNPRRRRGLGLLSGRVTTLATQLRRQADFTP